MHPTSFVPVACILLLLSMAISADAASIRSAGAAAPMASADGNALAQKVIADLGGKPAAWLLFARGKEKPEQQKIIDAVRAVDSQVPLIGCWTSTGTIAVQKGELASGEVMLIGVSGEGITFKTARADFTNAQNMPKAAAQLGKELKPASGKGLLILITDAIVSHGHLYDPQAMYQALQGALGPDVALIGGNAGYGDKPVYYNNEIVTKAMVGLMISGPISMKVIQEPGKVAVSPPMKVTKVSGGHQIVELDGKPWMDSYKEYVKDVFPPEKFDAIVNKGDGAFGQVSQRFPHALLVERDNLYVRLAHGLVPWGKGRNLPVEGSTVREGDRMVVTRPAPDQVAAVRGGLERLKKDMPAGKRLFLLFPCESNASIIQRDRKAFFSMLQEQVGEECAIGFFPTGEHASIFEPGLDKAVLPGRYHQLSYPMGIIVCD